VLNLENATEVQAYEVEFDLEVQVYVGPITPMNRQRVMALVAAIKKDLDDGGISKQARIKYLVVDEAAPEPK